MKKILTLCTAVFMLYGLTAQAQSIIEATDADFGFVPFKIVVVKEVIIRNNGSLPLTITGYTAPVFPQFVLMDWPIINETTPLILQSGEERHFEVRFEPTAEGTFSDKIVFKSDSKIEGGDNIAYLNARSQIKISVEEEAENTSFTIAPNPATGLATITLPAFKSQDVVLKAFDARGNEVIDFSNSPLKAKNSQFKFDTKTLPNGTYFLRFTDGKTTLSRSFIIQN